MDLTVVRGAPAHCLLADGQFAAEWATLARECPWATPFQSLAFAKEWYSIYRQPFEPVLVISRDAAGRLNGLLPLALSRAEGKLVAAGSHQAEYQAWLCLPELGVNFPREAFDLLRREFPAAPLRMRYIPAQTPLGFLSDPRQGRKTLLQASRRPLRVLGDGSDVEESLKKSGNKNRIRQLKRIGAIEFTRVTDPDEFAALLEEIVGCHDCRQLASHGSTPFLSDCRKKEFHLAMMKTPGLLHMTVMKVGEQVASVHLNIINGKEVQLFLIAHNPMFARFSPGKLHVLFLARMLRQEGFERLDLTPGGDAYKERFATGADEVHTLTVFPRPIQRARGVATAQIETLVRAGLAKASITTAQVQSVVWTFRDLGVGGLGRRLGAWGLKWLRSLTETRVYAYPAAKAGTLQVAEGIRRDCLSDLLAYKPDGSGPSRQEFMADAMERFESGQHVYTYVEGGRLLVFGWLAEETTPDAVRDMDLPDHSAAVLEFQACAGASVLNSLALRTMLRDAGRIEKLQTIFISLPSTNLPALDLVRAVGFNYQASIFKRTRFGRTQSWSQLAPRSAERRAEPSCGKDADGEESQAALQLGRPGPARGHAEALIQ